MLAIGETHQGKEITNPFQLSPQNIVKWIKKGKKKHKTHTQYKNLQK